MKSTAIALAIALGMALLPSCSNLPSLASVSTATVGTVTQLVPGTVIAARNVEVDSTDTQRSLGTGFGAAVGGGAGSLLGGGHGNFVSTIGFAVAGSALGRIIGNEVGKIPGQELTVKPDNDKLPTCTVVQPVYAEVGAIPVGVHGNL